MSRAGTAGIHHSDANTFQETQQRLEMQRPRTILTDTSYVFLFFFSSTTLYEFWHSQLFRSIASSLALSISSSYSLLLALVFYYPSVRLSIFEHF